MATIDVVNLGGEKVGSFELADEVFGAVNEDLLWEAVKHYRAGQRAGTHATKNKKLVSGAGKKLWKQKGTGRARVGSIRSPLWRHGGTVHGPQPRSYDYAFPRKKLLGALRSALAAKLADGKLVVVESFDVKEPKSKQFRQTLHKLNAKGTTLLVESSASENHNLHLEFAEPCRRGIAGGQSGSSLSPASLRNYDLRAPRTGEVAGLVEGHSTQAQACGGGVMKSAYQVLRRPVITEKGLGVKETEATLVFEVSLKATKTEIKQAVQSVFKVKVDSVRTASFAGKERRRGKFTGYRPDWKKAYVRLKAGEKMPEYAENL